MKPKIKITLREVTATDLPIFYDQQLDKEALQMADFPSREHNAFFAHWTKIMADDSNYLRTVLFNDQVAGNIVSFMMNGKREAGYWLGKAHWGKGIASIALKQFIEIVKERPLFAFTAIHNIASQKVLQKCGFEQYTETEKEIGWVLNRPRV